MKLFGQLIRAAVNLALVPVAVVADIVSGGGIMTGHNSGRVDETFTAKRIQQLKDEADDD